MATLGQQIDWEVVLLVEGHDDKVFFDRVVAPLVKKDHGRMLAVESSWLLNDVFAAHDWVSLPYLTDRCLSTIRKGAPDIPLDSVFLVSDQDEFRSEKQKKQHVLKHITELDDENIIVVERSIEGWYAAGVRKGSILYDHLGHGDPNRITKAAFRKLSANCVSTHERMMSNILDQYDLRQAVGRSPSLKKALERIGVHVR